MALGDTYATLDELKAYMSLEGQSSTDDQLADSLESASREIERHCKRQFNKTTTATARVFPRLNRCNAHVDDFYDITGLVIKTDENDDGTYETTWLTTDYELRPTNGVVDGLPGWPYWKLRAIDKYFPCAYRRENVLQVTALWGWAAVPAPVKQACLILSAETFQLKNAPLGVAGMGEFGVVRVRNNQMARDKLFRYARDPVLVG